MKKLFSMLLLVCIVIPLQIQAISMEAIKNDKNNVPILTGKNAITYFVDKSSIKRVEENEFIYKAQAVVYEVENNNSRRTNSYIHKVLVTYLVNVNIRMYNFDDVQCTVIPSVAYGFVTGMNLQLC